MGERLTNTFLELFLEKNSDQTKNLRLRGKELFQRIGKRLCDDDMKKLASFLKINIDIVQLDLCYNNIGDEGLSTLVRDAFLYYNNIEHLNLIGNNIEEMGIASLTTAVNNLKLKILRLSGNRLGKEGLKNTALLIGSMKSLQYLDVGDCDMTSSSFPYISAMLRNDIQGSGVTLKVLDISRMIPTHNLYMYDPSHFADQLGEMIKMNTSLVEIHAQKCEIAGHELELLIIGLARNNTLLMLDLGYNIIGNEGAQLLSSWLKTKPNLLGLNIAGNSIGDLGATEFSCGLPFSKIRLLDISHNKISDTAMSELLQSVKKVYKLKLLFIWGNDLGRKSLKILERQLTAGVFNQDYIDVKLYQVDGVLQAAYYPSNRYKHKYYCVLDDGVPKNLRIVRNIIDDLIDVCDTVKTKVDFVHYPKIE